MRKQFVTTTTEVFEKDERVVLMLGDIGVWGFNHLFHQYGKRVINSGIMEQASVGICAGLSQAGLKPIFHTIAPFLVERAYEQLKLDFGYQELGGNFVSVGASFDYAALGATHHAPNDVLMLSVIENFEIIVPGHKIEFDALFKSQYSNKKPTYYRLSENQNEVPQNVKFGKANIIKKGNAGTVVVIGPMLDLAIRALGKFDLTIIYYSTIKPFDINKLTKEHKNKDKLIIIEPFTEGTTMHMLGPYFEQNLTKLLSIGIPNKFQQNYGLFNELMDANNLSENTICQRVEKFLVNAERSDG